MDINYTSGRKLNKSLISRLAACEYISERRNLFITGATGCGKTYVACAFGMEACKRYFTGKYIRLPDLRCYCTGIFKKRIRQDKKYPGVLIQLRKSTAIWDIAYFVRDGVITIDELEGFCEDLIDAVKLILSR